VSRYGHIALDCENRKVITIDNKEINNIFEEKEDTQGLFEEESMREPIYDEEYVGADICEVFEEGENIDPIYDNEYGSDDIHEVFKRWIRMNQYITKNMFLLNMVNLWRLKEAYKQQ